MAESGGREWGWRVEEGLYKTTTKSRWDSSITSSTVRRHKNPQNFVQTPAEQRWKSQRIKIHWLGFRFSTRFLIYTLLRYGFLFGNQRHLAKVWDFWFADFFFRFLNSIGWNGFSHGFLFVLNDVFHQCFVQRLLIWNFKNAVLSDDLQKLFVS